MHLISKLAGKGKGDPSGVYFELWARAFDEGILTISDENNHAFAAGYTGTRAVRTWREHILRLQELGFIKVKALGNREIGHILLIDPLRVCFDLHKMQPNLVPDEWWVAFVSRASEIGARLTPLAAKKSG